MSETRFSTISEFIKTLLNQSVKYSGETSNPPIVSIISSYYNAHRYFEETYRSMMNQTMQNFEWIIVEDCSTDPDAISLFNSLKERSNKIKTFHHEENRGLSAGRNTAMSHATGKYLFFMDLDDIIDPTYLEKCVLFLELHPEFTFVSAYLVEFHDKEHWYPYIGGEHIPNYLEQNCWSSMSMHRRADFEKLGGFDEELRYFEDWERWAKAFANGQKAWTIPEYLQFYRRLASGLLSHAIVTEGKDKKIENVIKSRYRKAFELNPLQVPTLNRPTSFDLDSLRNELNIDNSLKWSNKGKRVLFLIPHLEVGGADKFNLDLLQKLSERDYALTIATTLKSSHPWQEHFYKITPDIFHLANISYDTDWLSILRYLIKSRSIEVVFLSNTYLGYYLVPILRALFPNVAFVDYGHSRGLGWRVDGFARISRQFTKYFDAQISAHHSLADYNYQNNIYALEKADVSYVSIDPQKWVYSKTLRQSIRRHYKISPEEILILFPARLEAEKRPELLIKIVAELIKKSLPVKVLVLGRGGSQPVMETLISELNLESYFQILPPVSPEEMAEFYSAADIVMLPSEYEGVSVVLYEAMAMGIPVVASDVGGQRELVTEGTGFLIEKGNGDEREIAEYVKILESLIKNKNLRESTGTVARERVTEFFSLDVMCEQVERVFEKAIKKRQENQEPIDMPLAEELLIMALENNLLESGWVHLANLLNEKSEADVAMVSTHDYDIEAIIGERDILATQKMLMEQSAFWKVRTKWFKLKKKVGLAKDQY